jgi:hypothetical protein
MYVILKSEATKNLISSVFLTDERDSHLHASAGASVAPGVYPERVEGVAHTCLCIPSVPDGTGGAGRMTHQNCFGK